MVRNSKIARSFQLLCWSQMLAGIDELKAGFDNGFSSISTGSRSLVLI